jgi:hypothetical protein
MRSNIVIAGGLILFAAIVMATLRPARFKAENEKVIQQGIVTEVYETAFKDLGLKLKGHASTYYISRAFDHGLSFKEMKERLLYRPVTIQYPERWTPLKADDAKFYISKLESDGEVIYHDQDKE